MGKKIICFRCKQDCYPKYITRKKEELTTPLGRENSTRNLPKRDKYSTSYLVSETY